MATKKLMKQSGSVQLYGANGGDRRVLWEAFVDAFTFASAYAQGNDEDIPDKIEVETRVSGWDADVQVTFVWEDVDMGA